MSSSPSPHAAYALALADDALISSQRLGWWISRAPQLEEDVALANIGLDQLGQARALLTHAGSLLGGQTEDDLAYFRDERDFRNVSLVERPMDDFGVAMARLLIFAAWQHELYAALTRSSDPVLAGVAGKAVKETAYHLDHAATWVIRLGDGTDESHARMQAALDAEWPWAAELFDDAQIDHALIQTGAAVAPSSLREVVTTRVAQIAAQATLTLPLDAAPAVSTGRSGRHTEAMGYLLAEMQHLARSHPGVIW